MKMILLINHSKPTYYGIYRIVVSQNFDPPITINHYHKKVKCFRGKKMKKFKFSVNMKNCKNRKFLLYVNRKNKNVHL